VTFLRDWCLSAKALPSTWGEAAALWIKTLSLDLIKDTASSGVTGVYCFIRWL
jgi:hypothetical protein